jgi:hypothetical protein
MNLLRCLGGLALALFMVGWNPVAAAEAPGPVRVYSHLIEPREHPDYERRAVKPPTWETFKNRTQFTTLRGFGVEGERIVGYAEGKRQAGCM